MKTPKEYLAAIGAKGGKKSRRKLTKKEARRIAKVRWAAGSVKASKQSGAGSQNVGAERQSRAEGAP